jgi:hypothetical protein
MKTLLFQIYGEILGATILITVKIDPFMYIIDYIIIKRHKWLGLGYEEDPEIYI